LISGDTPEPPRLSHPVGTLPQTSFPR
jgi:hypothetical protein